MLETRFLIWNIDLLGKSKDTIYWISRTICFLLLYISSDIFISQVWIKREVEFEEEKGDNDIDAGDDEILLSHDIKIEIDIAEDDSATNSKLQLHKSNVIILPFTYITSACASPLLSLSTMCTLLLGVRPRNMWQSKMIRSLPCTLSLFLCHTIPLSISKVHCLSVYMSEWYKYSVCLCPPSFFLFFLSFFDMMRRIHGGVYGYQFAFGLGACLWWLRHQDPSA